MKRHVRGPVSFFLVFTILLLLCLLLAPSVLSLWQTKPPKGLLSEDEIVAVIKRNRGLVLYSETGPGRVVVGVLIPEGCPADVLLQYVKGLPQLRELSLRRSNVTDAGLEHIQGLKHLEVLELMGTKITGAGLLYVQGLTNLEYLGLKGTRISGAGFAWLEPLTHLERLNLEETGLTGPDLRRLAQYLKGLPRVRYVKIDLNPDVTETARKEFQEALPRVQVP